MHKKHIFVGAVSIILIVLLLVLVAYSIKEHDTQYPFANLTVEQVIGVTAYFGNLEFFSPYDLSRTEISELVKELRKIVLYDEVDYTKYSSYQTLMFRIKMSNGECVCIAACSPIFIINEIGFMSDVRQCNVVGDIYWDCVEKIKNSSAKG